jgi:hypothetical protein
MHMKVNTDQFQLNGDRLTHLPKGAVFWMAEKDFVLCEQGDAGKVLSSGHDYDLEELKGVAWEIFQQQKASCL